MKKLRILFAILVVMVIGSQVNAQTLISSTTAYTTVINSEPAKSGRVKGLVLRPEIGIESDIDFDDLGFQANGTIAYQFNPYIAIGLGSGYERFNGYKYIPVFGNFRVYFSDTRWSPFLDLKLGMQKKEIMGSAMLGLQCKCFDFGPSIKYGYYTRYYHGYYGYSYLSDEWIIGINIAYNIQFGKKH